MSRRTGDLPSLREANRLRVLRELQNLGQVPQAELARRTGLSPASVSNIVGDALRSGLVVVTDGVQGRRVKLVSLSPNLGLAAGIAIDHRHVTVVVGNLSSEILHEETVPIDIDTEPLIIVETAARLTDKAVATVGGDQQLMSVGLTIPTPVPRRSADAAAVVRGAAAQGWWQLLPSDWLTGRFGVPAYLDNEANAAALSEWRLGGGVGCRDLLYVQVGDGVGAGLIINNQLYRGGGGLAGEIGHVILDPSGPPCRWGHRGCVEALSSGPAIVDAARAAGAAVSGLDHVIALARQGDPSCLAAMADAGTAIGKAVAMAVNLLNPQRVVIGGLVLAAPQLVMPAVRAAYTDAVLPSLAGFSELRPSPLGSDAGALGALALAIESLPETALLGPAGS